MDFQLGEPGSATERIRHLPSEDDAELGSRLTGAPELSCRKHPGKPSSYFISEEPWVQFCSKCALNMALCGKKIERRLSEQERRRKLQLEGIVFELRTKSKLAEEKEAEVKAKITAVESDYLVEVENLLRFYDCEIEEWTRKRNEVYKSYSEEILDYFKTLEEVRYRFSLSAMELKNTLQNVRLISMQIENNFVAIIHDIPASDFQQEVAQWRRNLEKTVDNQDKVFQFDKKRESFDKLVKQLTTKTEAFKTAKRWHPPASATVSNSAVTSMAQSCKVRLNEPDNSRRNQHSSTPQKHKVLQENLFSREEDLKLRLKPSISQVVSCSSKGNLQSHRSKRTNSKVGPPSKDEANTSRTQQRC